MSGRVLSVLRESGVESLNLTSCVRETTPESAFIGGRRHYSAVGNAAVARCLLPVVRAHLQKGAAGRRGAGARVAPRAADQRNVPPTASDSIEQMAYVRNWGAEFVVLIPDVKVYP